MPITILQVAKFMGIRSDWIDGSYIPAEEFLRLGLPFIGGCFHCHATIAPYNSCPTKTGFLYCTDCCTQDIGFETVESYEKFCHIKKGLEEVGEAIDQIMEEKVIDQERLDALNTQHMQLKMMLEDIS